jgi:hypothetical protein
MPEPTFIKLGMYIVAPEPIAMAFFANTPSVTPTLQPLKLMSTL